MAEMPTHQWQQCHCNKGNNAIAMTARMPVHQWWWWRHCNKGGYASLRMATTLLQIKGNNAIFTRATKLAQQRQGCACALTMATMLLSWGWQSHCDSGKNACALMATTPSQQGWWCQLENEQQGEWCYLNNGRDTCPLITGTMPSWQEQQSPSRQWQRHLRINGNLTITTRATTPVWGQATRVMALAWQWWKHLPINDGNNAIMTMAKTPAHQQRWQCYCYKGNNASLMHNEQLVCTFFLGRIGFLSKTALSHPS